MRVNTVERILTFSYPALHWLHLLRRPLATAPRLVLAQEFDLYGICNSSKYRSGSLWLGTSQATSNSIPFSVMSDRADGVLRKSKSNWVEQQSYFLQLQKEQPKTNFAICLNIKLFHKTEWGSCVTENTSQMDSRTYSLTNFFSITNLYVLFHK